MDLLPDLQVWLTRQPTTGNICRIPMCYYTDITGILVKFYSFTGVIMELQQSVVEMKYRFGYHIRGRNFLFLDVLEDMYLSMSMNVVGRYFSVWYKTVR